MRKQLKNSSKKASAGTPTRNIKEWNSTWKKVSSAQQKTKVPYIQDSEVSIPSWMDKSLFNPEEVMEVFTQTMQKLSVPLAIQSNSTAHQLTDAQAFLHSAVNYLQKKTIATQLEPSTESLSFQPLEGDEHPFLFLLHQSYLLNMQFLKEATGHPEIANSYIYSNLISYIHHLVDALSLATTPPPRQGILSAQKKSYSAKVQQNNNDKRYVSRKMFKTFRLGENLAAAFGKIVFQNNLFQLIQYESLTMHVARRPLLIVPSWFNKYYIFDLRLENSFIRWALNSGLTVFVISWVNPDERHQDKTWADYVLNGVQVALDQVCQHSQESEVNILGYCGGGTLVSCLMAYLSTKQDRRITSATFTATPFDFSKADELGIYRKGHRQTKLGEHDKAKDYLEGHYTTQALSLLRTNDLMWSSEVNHYLLGQATFPFDMLYWVCDGLQLPQQMHKTYLQKILMNNHLIKPGGLSIGDVAIDLGTISTPLFVMAAYEDLIAPWRSVYPLMQMVNSNSKKFVLGSFGHITGVFAHPYQTHNSYWTSELLPIEADQWLKVAQEKAGSWWNEWRQWLRSYEGELVPARTISIENILEEAPGSYVRTCRK